jgi:DNA helicase-2/ATP-dependent DNA helicase PcrA
VVRLLALERVDLGAVDRARLLKPTIPLMGHDGIPIRDELVLEVREAEKFRDDKPKGQALKLMTLHAAKGLEFDAVWMVGMEEGFLPHHRSLGDDGATIDEERRLCYVGVTRAKKRLTLSLAVARMKWGKLRPTRPSRFLYELTGQPERFRDEPAEAPAPARGKPAARRRRK